MQTTGVSNPAPLLRSGAAAQGGSVPQGAYPYRLAAAADDAFVVMLAAYRCSGGLARVDEVVALLESRGRPGVATLARWIVERGVISFEWQAQTWLPWFQFRAADHMPDAALRAVFDELSGVYDGWEMAGWFVRPNSALADGAPLDRIAGDPAAVLQAARADRFVARG